MVHLFNNKTGKAYSSKLSAYLSVRSTIQIMIKKGLLEAKGVRKKRFYNITNLGKEIHK